MLVLRNTKYIIQLIIIISRYCGDNLVLNSVYLPLYLRLYNILKYSRLQFISMGKVTAQKAWHNIYRRFISMIYIQYFQRNYIIRYICDFSLIKISGRQSTGQQTSCATSNWATYIGQLGDNAHNFFNSFCACVLFWLIRAEALFLFCCDRRR